MTYEQAIYYKLLLICGYGDKLENYITNALLEQDPISNIVLDLSFCGNEEKKLLKVLNDYILDIRDEDIDYDKVFQLILTFLRYQYTEIKMSVGELCELMYKIAHATDKYFDDPWFTMHTLWSLYDEAKDGYIPMDSFMKNFNSFINNGIIIDKSDFSEPKRRFSFKNLLHKILNH